MSFFVSTIARLFRRETLNLASEPGAALAIREFFLLRHIPSLVNHPVFLSRIDERWLYQMSTLALRYEIEQAAVQAAQLEALIELVKK